MGGSDDRNGGGALPLSDDRAFVPAASSQQAVSPVPASIPSAGNVLDSEIYDHAFFGIVNRRGELWTPKWFDSTQDAEAYLADTVRRWGKKFADLPRTHKVVPVRFWMQPTPHQDHSK